MMGQATNSFAPSHALRVWVDPRSIYFELSGVNGPTVLAFTRDSIGFAKALAVLFAMPEAGTPYSTMQAPSSIPDKNGITPAQRADAHELLKRLKII